MMERYVPVERRFSEYRLQEEETGAWSYVFGSSLYAPLTWKQVLGHRWSVVIALSGVGKTEEFKQQVKALREQGKPAFFCRLEDLANLPLASTLEIGEKPELEAWLSSADEGWFFLDSVDEAKLININHFKRAIDAFVDVITPHRTRVRMVLSSRPHAWDAYDAQMLCSKSMAAQLALLLGVPAPSYVLFAVIAAAGAATVLSFAVLAQYFPKEVSGRANAALGVLNMGAASACSASRGSSSPCGRPTADATRSRPTRPLWPPASACN